MTYCCVPFCTSNRKKPGCTLSFHEFPSDSERCEQWLKAISRKDNFVPNSNSASSVVCSLHFKEEDYSNSPALLYSGTYSHTATSIGKRRRLKPNAVPTIFPHYSNKASNIKKARRRKTGFPSPKIRKTGGAIPCSPLEHQVPCSSATANDFITILVENDHNANARLDVKMEMDCTEEVDPLDVTVKVESNLSVIKEDADNVLVPLDIVKTELDGHDETMLPIVGYENHIGLKVEKHDEPKIFKAVKCEFIAD